MFFMGASKSSESSRLQPMEQQEKPASGVENENEPALGRSERYLQQARLSSGGLDDDPTDSGAPVKNRRSFTNLSGGK